MATPAEESSSSAPRRGSGWLSFLTGSRSGEEAPAAPAPPTAEAAAAAPPAAAAAAAPPAEDGAAAAEDGAASAAPAEEGASPEKPAAGATADNNTVDVVFCFDATGSMGSYLDAAKRSMHAIADRLVAHEKLDVRWGLCAYRDHPQRGSSSGFVTRTFDFTRSRREMKAHLDTLSAHGGGDGPEAVAPALEAARTMKWRKDATKIVVLISDAPPHGLGESGDFFPNGDPSGFDPIVVARAMAEEGITIYSVGCEPAIQSYRAARAFLVTLAEITEGQALALASADRLADVIIGGAVEEVGLTALAEVAERVQREVELEAAAAGETLTEEMGYARVATRMQQQGVRSKQVRSNAMMSDSVYAPRFKEATSLAEARGVVESTAPPAPPAGAAMRSMGGLMRRGSGGAAPRRESRSARWSFGARAAAAPEGRAAPAFDAGDEMFEECDAAAGMAAPAAAAPSAAAAGAEYVDVEEDVVSYEQVSRMMRKNAKKSARA